ASSTSACAKACRDFSPRNSLSLLPRTRGDRSQGSAPRPSPLPPEGRVLRVPNSPRCVPALPIGERGKPTRPTLPPFPSGDSTRAAGLVRDSQSSSLQSPLAPHRRDEFYESPIPPAASQHFPSGNAGSPHAQRFPRSPQANPHAPRDESGTHKVRPSDYSRPSPLPPEGRVLRAPNSPRCVPALPIGERGKPTRPTLSPFPSGDSTRATGLVRDSQSSSLQSPLAPRPGHGINTRR
ncbi:MAG: hypothetical protein RIS76_1306, partial [Verrucomicrobiota bacterium]